MAGWAEVEQRFRELYTLDTDEPNEFALTVERADASGARKQRVMVRRYQAWGREMIEIRSAFGELGQVDPQHLLEDNLNLPLGAIALHGRWLVLVERACLDDLEVEGVLFLVTRVTLLADVLEHRLGGDRF